MNALFPSPVPARAETLSLFDHLRREERPSKYAPSATALRLVLTCPACTADLGPAPLNEALKCDCGLRMWPASLQLFIWRDEVMATVPAPAMAEG